ILHRRSVSMAVLDCPSCAKKLRVADGSEGQRIRCPACGHNIRGDQAGVTPAPPAAAATASTTAAMSQTPPSTPVSPPTKAKPGNKPADTAGKPKPKPDDGSPDVKKLVAMLRPPKEEGELGRLGSY